MMSVGDVDRLGAHQIGDFVFDVGIVNCPKLMTHAIERAGKLRPAEVLVEKLGHFAARVAEKSKDWAELRAVARMSLRRSSIGAAYVFSCGTTWPWPKGESFTSAISPRR